MTAPKKFRFMVEQVRTVEFDMWIEGDGVTEVDKAAAVARALANDTWNESSAKVIGLQRSDDLGNTIRPADPTDARPAATSVDTVSCAVCDLPVEASTGVVMRSFRGTLYTVHTKCADNWSYWTEAK